MVFRPYQIDEDAWVGDRTKAAEVRILLGVDAQEWAKLKLGISGRDVR